MIRVPVSPTGENPSEHYTSGFSPDEVLTMPNRFVVLEGFSVVSHGFPVVVNLSIVKEMA